MDVWIFFCWCQMDNYAFFRFSDTILESFMEIA